MPAPLMATFIGSFPWRLPHLSAGRLPLQWMTDLATTLRERLGLADPVPVAFERREVVAGDGFDRERIDYPGLEGDVIPAFLFAPKGREPLGGVVVFHQHNGQFHFG